MNINSLVIVSEHWFSGKESTCQGRRLRLDPWVGKIPWRREIATHSSIPVWETMDRGKSLGGYSPWGCKRAGHNLATKQQWQFPCCCINITFLKKLIQHKLRAGSCSCIVPLVGRLGFARRLREMRAVVVEAHSGFCEEGTNCILLRTWNCGH